MQKRQQHLKQKHPEISPFFEKRKYLRTSLNHFLLKMDSSTRRRWLWQQHPKIFRQNLENKLRFWILMKGFTQTTLYDRQKSVPAQHGKYFFTENLTNNFLFAFLVEKKGLENSIGWDECSCASNSQKNFAQSNHKFSKLLKKNRRTSPSGHLESSFDKTRPKRLAQSPERNKFKGKALKLFFW